MSNASRSFLEIVLSKIHTRSSVATSALILNIAGCALIYVGVRATGVINLKTAIFEGRIETGMVGILVVLAGVALSYAILRGQRARDRMVEISLGNGRSIRLSGVANMRDTLRILQPALGSPEIKETDSAHPAS